MSTLSRTREDFVQLWGELGSFWGASPAAARIFAWLYSQTEPADAEDLMAGLSTFLPSPAPASSGVS